MKVSTLLYAIVITIFFTGCASTGDKAVTAQGLFERHVEVSYGGKGQSALQSMTQLGTFRMDEMGIEAPFTVKAMKPNFMVLESEVMGMQLNQGCNNNGCWNIQPMQGSLPMEGESLDAFQQQADVFQYEHIDKYYETMEIVETETKQTSTK